MTIRSLLPLTVGLVLGFVGGVLVGVLAEVDAAVLVLAVRGQAATPWYPPP